MTEKEFIEELKKENINLSEKQIFQLKKYYEILMEENQRINLTRIIEENDVYLKHYYDSLTLNKVIDLNSVKTVADIGSGAGFPGIVLKIIYPHLQITLIDALEKRVQFLQKVIDELQLENVIAVHARMEEYSRLHEEEFDVITSRAVAKTNIILELGVRALKINGFFILLKGEVNDELNESINAIKKLNCNLKKKSQFYLYNNDNYRTILKIEKISKTPNQFPRDFSKIKKMPL